MTTNVDHETNIREKANALYDAITAGQDAGYRVAYPGSLHDLPKIAVSETGRVNAPENPTGDDFDSLSKAALQEHAAARGLNLPANTTKADLIAALRAPPQPATPVPKAPPIPVP